MEETKIIDVLLDQANEELLTDDWTVFSSPSHYRLSREWWMNAYLDIELTEECVKWYIQARLWDWTWWPVYLKKYDGLVRLDFGEIQSELEKKALEWDLFSK